MYETPFQHHHAMEPHARLASSDGDALTLHVAAQLPMSCRTTIAATLQIPPDKVRIIAKFIGGGFGGKLGTEADAVPSALAAQIRATGEDRVHATASCCECRTSHGVDPARAARR
jgi:xanthine dehydrogenase YagR molybdenum-binding subunit